MEYTIEIVKQLIDMQFPKWSKLEIKPVKISGHDNRMFHLGDEMFVRLPSHKSYEAQVAKEQQYLPIIHSHLKIETPLPLGYGKPSDVFNMEWSIYNYIEGDVVSKQNLKDEVQFAYDLANTLKDLWKIDVTSFPKPGTHNFFRGCSPVVYHQETQELLDWAKTHLTYDHKQLVKIWDEALQSLWYLDDVMVHGDIAKNNILIRNGKLAAIIDFGGLAKGDPACDLVMAWTYFEDESRQVFLDTLNLDPATINRAKGWALWKALLLLREHYRLNNEQENEARITIERILAK